MPEPTRASDDVALVSHEDSHADPKSVLATLATLATGRGDDGLDDLLRRGLDWLARLAEYDVATVFELDGDELIVRAARGPLAPKVRSHRLSLARFPTLREALETRRARAFTEDDHEHGDGDPFDGVLDLPPGHSCMVVPLCAGERRYGVLTLDRTRCETYPPDVVSLVEVYAQILALAIENARQRADLERLHAQEHAFAATLQSELEGAGMLARSESPAMRRLLDRARQVARTATPVLVLGETGTGKERLSRALHRWSDRAERPFVTLNCAAIPEALLESELFGHVKGAFTGATRDRPGRFAIADGGTLLLDEIGELSLPLQAKLLRVLQEGTLQPVGSDTTRKVDVRVIAATHVELERAVQEGRFREDLYYRLAVFPLELPPLRERLEDLPALAEAMLEEQSARTGRRGRLTGEALDALRTYAWPGNLRELANVLERATILSRDGALRAADLDLPRRASRAGSSGAASPATTSTTTSAAAATTLAEGPLVTWEEAERAYLIRVLRHTKGKIYGTGGAAEILGTKPSTLQSRMKKLGVERDSFR
jgi:transcriptional regulator with GAF, ATPase, and Fis domain